MRQLDLPVLVRQAPPALLATVAGKQGLIDL
jgi:hypothetical protein